VTARRSCGQPAKCESGDDDDGDDIERDDPEAVSQPDAVGESTPDSLAGREQPDSHGFGPGHDLGGIDTPWVIIRIDQKAPVRRSAARLPGLPAFWLVTAFCVAPARAVLIAVRPGRGP
jgi:hypothetical protein